MSPEAASDALEMSPKVASDALEMSPEVASDTLEMSPEVNADALRMSSEFCDAQANKTLRPEPLSLRGSNPRLRMIGRNLFQKIFLQSGAWEVKSPYFDQGCNYTDNADGWTWRFTVRNYVSQTIASV